MRNPKTSFCKNQEAAVSALLPNVGTLAQSAVAVTGHVAQDTVEGTWVPAWPTQGKHGR